MCSRLAQIGVGNALRDGERTTAVSSRDHSSVVCVFHLVSRPSLADDHVDVSIEVMVIQARRLTPRRRKSTSVSCIFWPPQTHPPTICTGERGETSLRLSVDAVFSPTGTNTLKLAFHGPPRTSEFLGNLLGRLAFETHNSDVSSLHVVQQIE